MENEKIDWVLFLKDTSYAIEIMKSMFKRKKVEEEKTIVLKEEKEIEKDEEIKKDEEKVEIDWVLFLKDTSYMISIIKQLVKQKKNKKSNKKEVGKEKEIKIDTKTYKLNKVLYKFPFSFVYKFYFVLILASILGSTGFVYFKANEKYNIAKYKFERLKKEEKKIQRNITKLKLEENKFRKEFTNINKRKVSEISIFSNTLNNFDSKALGFSFKFTNSNVTPSNTFIVHEIQYKVSKDTNEDIAIYMILELLKDNIYGVQKIDKKNNIIYVVEKI